MRGLLGYRVSWFRLAWCAFWLSLPAAIFVVAQRVV